MLIEEALQTIKNILERGIQLIEIEMNNEENSIASSDSSSSLEDSNNAKDHNEEQEDRLKDKSFTELLFDNDTKSDNEQAQIENDVESSTGSFDISTLKSSEFDDSTINIKRLDDYQEALERIKLLIDRDNKQQLDIGNLFGCLIDQYDETHILGRSKIDQELFEACKQFWYAFATDSIVTILTIYEEVGLDLESFGTALALNKSIRTLLIGGKHLSSSDIYSLVPAIGGNKHLKELEIYSRRAEDDYCLVSIAKIIKQHPSLQILRLELNDCYPDTMTKVAKALVGNRILQELKVKVDFELKYLKKFLTFIARGTDIKCLNIDSIDDEYLIKALNLLKMNSQLTKIYVENCILQKHYIDEFINFLHEKNSLMIIEVDIDIEAIIEFQRLLSENNVDRSLILNISTFSKFNENYIDALIKLVKGCESIISLDFKYNCMAEEYIDCLLLINDILKNRIIDKLINVWDRRYAYYLIKILNDKHEIDIDQAYDGWTFLHFAIYNNDIETIQYLLSINANQMIAEENGALPLHFAAKYLNHEYIYLFSTASINIEDNQGETPLFYAAKSGKIDTLKRLCQMGGDLYHYSGSQKLLSNLSLSGRNGGNKRNLLDIAIINNHIETVEYLLSKNFYYTRMYIENYTNDDNIDKCIIDLLIKNYDTHQMLKLAIQDGQYQLVMDLVEKNQANLNWEYEEGCLPLDIAIQYHKVEICVFLKSRGAESRINSIGKLNIEEQKQYKSLISNLYVYRDAKSVISNLINNTLIFAPATAQYQFIPFVKSLYKILYGIGNKAKKINHQYLKPILAVLAKLDDLVIIFDPSKESIDNLDPQGHSGEVGVVDTNSNTVLLGGKNKDKQDILGTIIHEFTHLVCRVLWENKANPYRRDDIKIAAIYKQILESLSRKYKDDPSSLDRIIARVFETYERRPEQQAAELIVRVPQILAYYGADEGINILLMQAPELWQFYNQYFLATCKQFLEKEIVWAYDEQKQVERPLNNDNSHTFIYHPPEKHINTIMCVHLAGSFNAWLNAENGKINGNYPLWEMLRINFDTWQINVRLEPGVYEFKYVINKGAMWHADDDPKYARSSKYLNSIITVVGLNNDRNLLSPSKIYTALQTKTIKSDISNSALEPSPQNTSSLAISVGGKTGSPLYVQNKKRGPNNFPNFSTNENVSFRNLVPSLLGRMPNNDISIEFEEHFVTPDGNCGFTALGIDRQQLVASLLPLENNFTDRESLAKVIEAALRIQEIKPPDAAGQQLMDLIYYAQGNLDTMSHKIKYALTDEIAKELESDHLITWLQKHDRTNEAQALSEHRLALYQAEKELEIYCQSPAMFKHYIKSFVDTALWLDYKSALLYARQANITLYIWKKEENNIGHLTLIDHYKVIGNDQNEIHLLFTSGFTHFNLLSKSSSKKIEDYISNEKMDNFETTNLVTINEKEREFKRELPKEEFNKFQANLLLNTEKVEKINKKEKSNFFNDLSDMSDLIDNEDSLSVFEDYDENSLMNSHIANKPR